MKLARSKLDFWFSKLCGKLCRVYQVYRLLWLDGSKFMRSEKDGTSKGKTRSIRARQVQKEIYVSKGEKDDQGGAMGLEHPRDAA